MAFVIFQKPWSLILGALLFALAHCSIDYRYRPVNAPDSFEQFFQDQVRISKSLPVRPNNEEKLIRFAPRTKYAILAIHGYGASPAGVELTATHIANKLQANTYMMRLPGHGIDDPEAHGRVTAQDYLQMTETAFQMMHLLGDRIIIVGSSTGGLLGTWLAAKYPDQVDALILGSPFYDWASSSAVIMKVPGRSCILDVAMPEYRDASWQDPRKHPDYDSYWLLRQRYDALLNLEDLRDYIVSGDTFQKVKAPVLLVYYYKNEQEQDDVASVAAMRDAFAIMGQNKGSLEAPIADANHIIFSAYVRTDKKAILGAVDRFLSDLQMRDH
ncbi:MAG: alpha/beta fold hydrolase [Leptospiraceae bacterium]|nr:alpha/beta fold hydrolase [Leptospiraceae bacterium]